MRFLAASKGYKLRQDVKTGRLHYWYDCSKMVGSPCLCNYSLLCEVGAPYQGWFRQQIVRLGLKIKTVETEKDFYEVTI